MSSGLFDLRIRTGKHSLLVHFPPKPFREKREQFSAHVSLTTAEMTVSQHVRLCLCVRHGAGTTFADPALFRSDMMSCRTVSEFFSEPRLDSSQRDEISLVLKHGAKFDSCHLCYDDLLESSCSGGTCGGHTEIIQGVWACE